MLSKLALIFVFNFVSINNISFNKVNKQFDNEKICPNNLMTEGIFNSDFSSYITMPDIDLLRNDRVTYFYNLCTYSPKNSHGSCGYVSLIQYLSYYDCFYNDSIIDECYERNQGDVTSLDQARTISPGVLRQSYPSSSTSLYDFIQDNMDDDYQMKLMYIVNEAHGRSRSSYSYSVGMWDYFNIINTISAFENTSFSYKQVEDFGPTAIPTDANVVEYFDSFVKEQLDCGNPVLLHIARYNAITQEYDSYHSVVAYYYDSNGIHANFGWGPDSTDTIISSSYQITEAGVIDFDNVLENHSNNFHVNGAGYCGCGLHTEHGYFHYYLPFSSDKHRAFCDCGEYVLKPHAVQAGSGRIIHGHTFANCVDCGALVDLGSSNVVIEGLENTYLLSDNGSYILPNGVLVIVFNDLEDYFSGNLIFHRREQMLL